MTRVGGPFEPAIDRIPGDSLDSCDGGLVKAFDAEGGDLVEGRAAMLQSMVRRPGVGAESLAASPASVSTALSELGLVEAVADDPSGSGFPDSGHSLFVPLRLFLASGPVNRRTGHPKLSLKSQQLRELRLDRQQLTAEALAYAWTNRMTGCPQAVNGEGGYRCDCSCRIASRASRSAAASVPRVAC